MNDPFNLDRFLRAQDPVLKAVQLELANGAKRTHWMWFVFPQLSGLGHSSMAQRYALASLQEAEAYLHHSILGPRLVACTNLVNGVTDRSVHEIFGSPDDLKFHSSMTLFARVPNAGRCFAAALGKFFDGASDTATLALIAA